MFLSYKKITTTTKIKKYNCIKYKRASQIAEKMYLKLSKIWYLICFVFCVHNLVVLFKDKDSVNYIVVEKDDDLYDNKTNYLLCTHFSDIQKKSNLELKNLKLENVSVPVFLYFTKLIYENYLNLTNLFNLNESYIFNNCVCFRVDKEDLEVELPVRGYLGNFTVTMFIYSDGKIPYFNEVAHDKTTGISSAYMRVLKQKVYGQNYLENRKCSNFNEQLSFNKFNCINKCRKKYGVKTGLLDIKDNIDFDLNKIFKTNETSTEIIYPHEDVINGMSSLSLFYSENDESSYVPCLEECLEIKDCFYETTEVSKLDHLYFKKYLEHKGVNKIDLKTNIYKAYYSLQDFYPQLFGLLSLFTGASVISILQKLFDKTIKAARKFNYLKFILSRLKIVIIVIVVSINLYISYLFIEDYNLKLNYPNRTLSLTYSSKPFSLIFCIPLEILIYNDNRIEEGRNSRILDNYSLNELETKTNGLFDSQLKVFTLYFAHYNSPLNKTISERVLFKNGTADNKPCLQRCFRVEVESKEDYEYKQMLPFHNYVIKMKHIYWELFIVDKEQNFTSNLIDMKTQFYITKQTSISSKNSKKSNCLDYLEKYSNCDSKISCINRCVVLKFFKKYKTLPLHSLIDKQMIAEFSDLDFNRTKFNGTQDSDIEAECLKLFTQKDCVSNYFEESLEIISNYDIGKNIFINLNYESIVEEELDESWIKLLFNIINIKSIFFGLNASGLLYNLFPVLRVAFNFNQLRSYRFSILFVCWIGFSIHCFLIFKSLVDGNFIQSGYFSTVNNFTLPNVIFCFSLEKYPIDPNRRLDAKYLDELSYKLTFERIFYSIQYNNQTHSNAIYFNELDMKDDYFSNTEIELSYFYMANSKCFEINLNLTYKNEYGYIQNDKRVLKVSLRNQFSKLNKQTFLFYKEKTTNQIGRGFHYTIGLVPGEHPPIENNSNFFYTYDNEFELYQKKSEDIFEKLKNPKALFLNLFNFYSKEEVNLLHDTTKYLENMKSSFKDKYNLTSKNIILDRQNFDLEINERLLDQYYIQKQRINDLKLPITVNYEQRSYNVYSRIDTNWEGYKYFDFAFSHSLISRNLDIKNEDNYAKLILNILNTLSLWLNICILFVHNYLMLTSKAFLKVYRFMILFKNKTKLNLND